MSVVHGDHELERYLAEVIIGPAESAEIKLVAYDPVWAERFRREAGRIHAALGDDVRVEHIGSTSVPGLAAKPIVDILLVLDDPADKDSYLPALERAGYELRVREPDFWRHRMLRTPERDVHVHVFPPASPEVERYLVFRDRLRAEPEERELYAATKRRLAARDWATMDHYAQAKTDVIEAIISRAADVRKASSEAGQGRADAREDGRGPHREAEG